MSLNFDLWKKDHLARLGEGGKACMAITHLKVFLGLFLVFDVLTSSVQCLWPVVICPRRVGSTQKLLRGQFWKICPAGIIFWQGNLPWGNRLNSLKSAQIRRFCFKHFLVFLDGFQLSIISLSNWQWQCPMCVASCHFLWRVGRRQKLRQFGFFFENLQKSISFFLQIPSYQYCQ